jgi:hypothetical protein
MKIGGRKRPGHGNVVSVFILLTGGLFVICVLASIGEAICERDWPRDTFKLVVFSALAFIASLGA